MRARYVINDEYLTDVGRWIASRLPHWTLSRNPWQRDQGDLIFRVFGGKPLYRMCILDFTRARLHTGEPQWFRLRLFGLTVYEKNAEYSGLPSSQAKDNKQ